MNSLFKSVKNAPHDPILGLNDQYNNDIRKGKINLGVGIYYNELGEIPLLQSIHQAELAYVKCAKPRGYLPINGLKNYNYNTQLLLFGPNSHLIEEGRVITVQTLGGTGALKIGGDFLRQLLPQSKIMISNPSWDNHRAIFEFIGFFVDTYTYYDFSTNELDFHGLTTDIKNSPKQTIVVFHACCHNPTGMDPNSEQWKEIASIVKTRNLIPFIDIAYQGFGEGLEQDSYPIRIFAKMGISVFISSSFSKSFSLYGERVGALTIITNNKNETENVLSQIKKIIRVNYSNPPTHGASIISHILSEPKLFSLWKKELTNMRERIYSVRKTLVQKLEKVNILKDFSFILKQRGMFSFSGLDPIQVSRLRKEYGIYIVSNGRICMAALNEKNIDDFISGFINVFK